MICSPTWVSDCADTRPVQPLPQGCETSAEARQRHGEAQTVVTLLAEQQDLPLEYRDHALRGDWVGFRDLHIEPDWLLLYRIAGNEVQLACTGTHSDLFRD
jgi:mRNA interferase YafQ